MQTKLFDDIITITVELFHICSFLVNNENLCLMAIFSCRKFPIQRAVV